jgi:hypothetical protein
VKLHPVPPEHAETVFTILAQEVASIADRSRRRVTVPDLLEAVHDEKLFAWVAVDDRGALVAIVFAEIRDYPRAKVCRLVGCAGRGRRQWLPLLAEIEQWAASVGCSQMHAEARRGWAGDLVDYRLTHVLLEKDIAHVVRTVGDADRPVEPAAVERAAALPV